MTMSYEISVQVERLLKRDVVIPCPASVEVDASVDVERIAPGVVIHTGCRISGARTSIGPDCVIGAEGPATIDNCQLGRAVALKGGYFSGAVFLDGSSMGSAAHVRPGTLLEELASGAHAVGFKQTILLPFVTAGSLINFCDCLMAGGTSRKNHSEIGSSYVHFNFTPHQDKATPSMIGDVPRGVMLDQAPVFLGGQGGLVGPSRVGFGCVIPAGVIYRGDSPEEGHLLVPEARTGKSKPYRAGAYRDVRRLIANNLVYIGNIYALQAWYKHVRKEFMSNDPWETACWEGAVSQIAAIIGERVKRLREVADKMPESLKIARASGALSFCHGDQEEFMRQWPELEAKLKAGPDESVNEVGRDVLLKAVSEAPRKAGYLEFVRSLDPEVKRAGVSWLQGIVEAVSSSIWTLSA